MVAWGVRPYINTPDNNLPDNNFWQSPNHTPNNVGDIKGSGKERRAICIAEIYAQSEVSLETIEKSLFISLML